MPLDVRDAVVSAFRSLDTFDDENGSGLFGMEISWAIVADLNGVV